MSLSATYTVGNPAFNLTSGGTPQATLVLTYAMTGDGSSTTFVHPVGGFGLGTPSSVIGTITKQQITGTPPAWQKNTAYALNAFVQANGFIQKVTTAGTSMSGWAANFTYATNATICDPYGNLQTASIGGTSGTSLPSNFAANMAVGALTVDNGVTWQCTANICPNFSNVTNATTNDNTVVWTCQGPVVAATYDAPGITPTLSGTNLTLTFSEALKAPGATNTDAYGNIFTYTTWVVSVTLTFTTFSSVVSNAIQTGSATWTSATALNSGVTINTLGIATVVVNLTVTGSITSGGLVGFQVSEDNINFTTITGTASNITAGYANAWSPAVGTFSYVFNVAGYAFFRALLSSVIVGTGSTGITVQGSAIAAPLLVDVFQGNGSFLHTTLDDSAGGNAVNTVVKGTQAARALGIQDLKDSGRSFITLSAQAAAGVVAEAMFSMGQNKAGTVTGAVTSYTITSGKTLRIQNISYSVRAGAAAVPFSRITLRSNTAGATIATSAILHQLPEVTGPAATTGVGGTESVDFPDGLEIAGNGTISIGLSHLDQATTNVVNVTLTGYEY